MHFRNIISTFFLSSFVDVMTLFSKAASLDITCRIWDLLIRWDCLNTLREWGIIELVILWECLITLWEWGNIELVKYSLFWHTVFYFQGRGRFPLQSCPRLAQSLPGAVAEGDRLRAARPVPHRAAWEHGQRGPLRQDRWDHPGLGSPRCVMAWTGEKRFRQLSCLALSLRSVDHWNLWLSLLKELIFSFSSKA